MPTFVGERRVPDVQSIPGGVDGVVVISRPDATEQTVRQEHGISVIAGARPMMYGPADFGRTCMRWIRSRTGQLPQ